MTSIVPTRAILSSTTTSPEPQLTPAEMAELGWTVQRAAPAPPGLLNAQGAPLAPPVAPSSLESQLLDYDGLLALPSARWLIRGVLELNSESWLIGPPGGFKSFVAIDWACHVAAGIDWRGKPLHEGDVLYVVAEGTKSFAKRIEAWVKHHDVKPGRLRVLPVAVQARGELGVSAEWGELVALATKLKPSLIVLDTQARMTVGMEENSAKEMGVWVRAVNMLKTATEACVLVVHHTGRDGKDARGSSAIDAAQDTEWKVVRVGDRKALTADLVMEKNKDGDDRTRFSFNLEEVDLLPGADGEGRTSLVLGDDAMRKSGPGNLVDSVQSTAREAASFQNREWLRRMLAAQDHDGAGLTNSQLLTTINEERKRLALEPVKRTVFNSMLSKMVAAGELYRINNGRTSIHDPNDAPPLAGSDASPFPNSQLVPREAE